MINGFQDGTYKKAIAYIMVGIFGGATGEWMEHISWILGVAIQVLSILSLMVGIFISLPKIEDAIRWFKRGKAK